MTEGRSSSSIGPLASPSDLASDAPPFESLPILAAILATHPADVKASQPAIGFLTHLPLSIN
jgi:hypothetical protein